MRASTAPETSADELSIDIFDILTIIRRTWLRVLSISAVVATLFGAYQYFKAQPYFVSRATILAGGSEGSLNLGALSQFLPRASTGSSQLSQFEKMLKTRAIERMVVEKLAGRKELGKAIKFSTKTDAGSVEIEFKATSAAFALAGAQAYLDSLAAMVQEASTAKALANETFIKARLTEAEAGLSRLEGRIPGMRLSEASREQQIQTKVVLILREQYELAQIETKKQQLTFQVIDPPTLPIETEGGWTPKPMFMVFLMMLCLVSILSVVTHFFSEEKQRRVRPRTKA